MIYTSHHNHGFEKVLNLLKTHETEYLSGQDLSDVLKISRVAVWKHIKKIRTLGYKIESKQKLGYRLVELAKKPFPWEVCQGLETKWIGKRIYYFDTIDSTQTFALEIASDKEDGTVIIAQKQTKGRGRMKRRWISPEGGIWLSIIIKPKADASLATIFPLAVSVALSRAIQDTLGVKPELKWPNDLLINGKKIAGILVDASLTSNQIDYMVLGIGINFDVPVKSIEKKIKNTGNYSGVASLTNTNTGDSIPLIQSFLSRLEESFESLTSNKKKILNQWSRRSSTIGNNITVKTEEGKIRGKATKIDSDGALILKSKNKTHRILAGDIIQ